MPITDYVGIVKVSGQEYLTGSTLFGICTTAEYEPAKIVKIESITNFTPTHGLTIHILFTNSNTATRPTIQFSTDSNATKYLIYQFGTTKVGNSISTSWRAGAIVSLTFMDGELESPATDKRWVLNSSIDTGADGLASVTLEHVENADNLKAIEELTSTGYLKRTGDRTWALQTLDVTGGSASQTLTGITENNGNIQGTFAKINITKSQINDLFPESAGTTKYLKEDGSWEVPPDTHHQAKLISGGSATATTNADRTADQNSIFLNVIENSAVRSSHKIMGGGTTKVSSDAQGNITITSADSKEGTVISITPGAGLVNGATTSTSQAAITDSGTISIKAGGVTNDMLAGDIANTKLANSSMSIAGSTVSLGGTLTKDALISALGIGTAVHYIGNSSTAITNGGTQQPTIDGSEVSTLEAGDVVLYGNQEYIWTTADNWELFGDQGSYALKTAAVTDVAWNSTNNKLTKTINNSTSDVVTIDTIKTALALGKGDVGLGSVTDHAQVTSLQWDKTNKKITYKVSEGTAKNVVTFAAGSNISLTAANNQLTIANTYSYTLSAATDDNLGGIRTGYTQSGKTYPVVLDSNNKAYVSVPWTDTNTKVTQVLDSSADTFPLLFSDNKTSVTTESITSSAKRVNTIYIQPSTGTLTATKFSGNGSGLTGITTDHISGTGTGTKYLRQDGWKTVSVSVTQNNSSGKVLTGFTYSAGTLPTFTQGTKASASVANGVLTIINQTDDTFTQGAITTITNITKADLDISGN